MGEDHAAAAVALQTDLVEGVAAWVRCVSAGARCACRGGYGGFGCAGAAFRMGIGENSPFFHVLGEETHVFLPEIADDLRDCQYALRLELGGAWGGCTLPQEKQRMGTIILGSDNVYGGFEI